VEKMKNMLKRAGKAMTKENKSFLKDESDKIQNSFQDYLSLTC
jgi:hypothetical protein